MKAFAYKKDYWRYQRPVGEFGGWANAFKFSENLKADDSVLDFGCGGGFLLENLNCELKEGLEVNEHACIFAEKKGFQIYRSVEEIPNARFTKIISNHALEHCQRPLDELVSLKPKLIRGGQAIFYVPCESHKRKFHEGDKNQHLYTWSPMNLGNLFLAAGYQVLKAETVYHRWPYYYK